MIPTSGAITAAQINAELGRAAGTPVSLDSPGVRLLACDNAKLAGGSPISLNDLRGRSGFLLTLYMKSFVNEVGAAEGDGVNPSPLGTIAGGTVPISRLSTTFPTSGFALKYTGVNMKVPQPYARFFAIGVWDASWNYVGSLLYSAANVFQDVYASSGFITVGWQLPTLDLRPYVNQTLNFIFFI